MRKIMIWRILPLVVIALLGWGGLIIVESLEPDKARPKPKVVSSLNSGPSSSSGSGAGAPEEVQVVPIVAPVIQPTTPSAPNHSIPSFSRNGASSCETDYDPNKDFAKNQIWCSIRPKNLPLLRHLWATTLSSGSSLKA